MVRPKLISCRDVVDALFMHAAILSGGRVNRTSFILFTYSWSYCVAVGILACDQLWGGERR